MSILIFAINNFQCIGLYLWRFAFFFCGVKTIVSQTSIHHIGLEPRVRDETLQDHGPHPLLGRSYLNGTSRLVILSECYNTNG